MKKLILLTGPSTAGKTTLIRALGHAMPNAHILVQSACREPRKDDDPRFIKSYSRSEFDGLDFWVHYGQFGIANDDIRSFVEGPAEVAFSVSGVREVAQAKSIQDSRLTVGTILVRMSADAEKERQLVRDGIVGHFKDPAVRLEQNERLLNEFFLNANFIHGNIDLTLSREMPLSSWIQTVATTFGITHLLDGSIAHASDQALEENAHFRATPHGAVADVLEIGRK